MITCFTCIYVFRNLHASTLFVLICCALGGVCVCATTAAECGIDFSALRQKFGPNQCERVCEGNITQRRRTQRKSGKKGDAKAKQQNNK